MLNLIKSYSFTIVLFLILFTSSFLIACTNQSTTQQKPNIIKQSYTVTEVHKDHVTASSDKYNNELINFYYEDQINKQHFNVNDKLIAYFKPYNKSYQIVDFKKVNTNTNNTLTDTLTLTSINKSGYYFQSTKAETGAFIPISDSNKYNISTLKLGDKVTMVFNDKDDIVKVIKK